MRKYRDLCMRCGYEFAVVRSRGRYLKFLLQSWKFHHNFGIFTTSICLDIFAREFLNFHWMLDAVNEVYLKNILLNTGY